MNANKTYLGDGLYADFDGTHVILSTERSNGIHYVGLDGDEVLPALFRFVEKIHNVSIKITSNQELCSTCGEEKGQCQCEVG